MLRGPGDLRGELIQVSNRENCGRITNITEAPLFRGETISGAKAAFAKREDRGPSPPRGVAARFG